MCNRSAARSGNRARVARHLCSERRKRRRHNVCMTCMRPTRGVTQLVRAPHGLLTRTSARRGEETRAARRLADILYRRRNRSRRIYEGSHVLAIPTHSRRKKERQTLKFPENVNSSTSRISGRWGRLFRTDLSRSYGLKLSKFVFISPGRAKN